VENFFAKRFEQHDVFPSLDGWRWKAFTVPVYQPVLKISSERREDSLRSLGFDQRSQ
jgi:hypothetical protein